jgi:hypothetical protein
VDVDALIDQLTAERQRLWSEGGRGEEIDIITKKLADLYDLRRRSRTELLHGNPVEIIRRARIESELERLMAQD